ncbi:MAG: hypothetical protein RLZZ511_3961 [Cyanobacteriota bacterium]
MSDFGEVEIERPVFSEVHTIDLLFNPNPDRIQALEPLGLLGRMLTKRCHYEVMPACIQSIFLLF